MFKAYPRKLTQVRIFIIILKSSESKNQSLNMKTQQPTFSLGLRILDSPNTKDLKRMNMSPPVIQKHRDSRTSSLSQTQAIHTMPLLSQFYKAILIISPLRNMKHIKRNSKNGQIQHHAKLAIYQWTQKGKAHQQTTHKKE